MPKKQIVDWEQTGRILELRTDGHSMARIGEILGLSARIVSRVLKENGWTPLGPYARDHFGTTDPRNQTDG